jgi:hypothetical protein
MREDILYVLQNFIIKIICVKEVKENFYESIIKKIIANYIGNIDSIFVFIVFFGKID